MVVAASPSEQSVALALYLDGVPFLKRDGLLGLTMYNLCSGERHLLLVVRAATCVAAVGGAGLRELDRDSARRGCHAEDEARRHALDHGGRGPSTTSWPASMRESSRK